MQKYLAAASKDQLVSAARDNGAPDDLVAALENAGSDSFDSPMDVSSAVSGG